jgi:hypothetical protein
MEVLKRPVSWNLKDEDGDVSVAAASLDDLTPGLARDFSVLLAALSASPATNDGPAATATASDARQAIEHLFGAMEALDELESEIRSFARLSEPLVKQLARLAAEGDEAFRRDLAAFTKERGGNQGSSPASIDAASLAQLCAIMAPYWYEPGTDGRQRAAMHGLGPSTPGTFDPAFCLKSLINLRNAAVHRTLPSGARLAPYMQTMLAAMACLFGPERRLSAIRRNLATRGRDAFLVTEYLARVRIKCAPRPPAFLTGVIEHAAFVARRVTRPPGHKDRQDDDVTTPGARPALPSAEFYESLLTVQDPKRAIGLLGLLREADRIWVKAEGGFGKSELLRGLARQLATEADRRLLPIYVPLTRYRPHALLPVILEEFGIRDVTELPPLRGWCPVLLLDGFNELDRPSQAALLDDLEQLRGKIGEHKLCMASRTSAPAGSTWLTSALVPFDDADVRTYLASLQGKAGALDVESFLKAVESRPYWTIAQENPLFLTLCAAYVLQYPGQGLPESEAAIFKRLVDDYYEREADKTPWLTEAEVLATREVFQELAWHSFTMNSLTMPEAPVRSLVAERLGARAADPFATLIRTGFVEREAGAVRFIHQRLRDFLAAEYLARVHLAPQEVDDAEPLVSPISAVEDKILATLVALEKSAQPPPPDPVTVRAEGKVDDETARQSWLQELLRDGAKLLQYVLEFSTAAMRLLYVRELMRSEPDDYFWGGFHYSALEGVCRIHRAFPHERLLSTDDLVTVFRRARAKGPEYADFAAYAIASSGMEGLADALAREMPVATNVTLADFPGDLQDREHVRNLAHSLNFPAYWYFSLWRLDPVWAHSRLPDVLRFMTLSADASDQSNIIVFLTRTPTEEILAKPTKTGVKRYVKDCACDPHGSHANIAPVLFMVQNNPDYWDDLYKLATLEIRRSRQLFALFDLLGQQYHEEYFRWDPWLKSFSGLHAFMPPVDTFPKIPAAKRDELQVRIWEYKDKLAVFRGVTDGSEL